MQKVPAIYEVRCVRSADSAHAHLVTTALGRVLPFTRHQTSVSELQCAECGQHDTSVPVHQAADKVLTVMQFCSYGTRRLADWYTTLQMEAAKLLQIIYTNLHAVFRWAIPIVYSVINNK